MYTAAADVGIDPRVAVVAPLTGLDVTCATPPRAKITASRALAPRLAAHHEQHTRRGPRNPRTGSGSKPKSESRPRAPTSGQLTATTTNGDITESPIRAAELAPASSAPKNAYRDRRTSAGVTNGGATACGAHRFCAELHTKQDFLPSACRVSCFVAPPCDFAIRYFESTALVTPACACVTKPELIRAQRASVTSTGKIGGLK